MWPAVIAHALNNASLVLAGKMGEDSLLRTLHDPTRDGYTPALITSTVVLAASLAAVTAILRRTTATNEGV